MSVGGIRSRTKKCRRVGWAKRTSGSQPCLEEQSAKVQRCRLANLPAAAHQNTPSNPRIAHRTDRGTNGGRTVGHDAGVMTSLEVVETNPVLDVRNATAKLGVELILSALGKSIY